MIHSRHSTKVEINIPQSHQCNEYGIHAILSETIHIIVSFKYIRLSMQAIVVNHKKTPYCLKISLCSVIINIHNYIK